MFDLDSLTLDIQNEFQICVCCKGPHLKTLIPRLKKLDPNVKIKGKTCLSYCGPGRDYPFVFLNNKPIRGQNEDDLIAKIKEVLEKQ